MPWRRITRKYKKRMTGGANFKGFLCEFKVGITLGGGYDPDLNFNYPVEVEDEQIIDDADKIAEILEKRILKRIELGKIQHIRNLQIKHLEGIEFQLYCKIDVDEVADRLQFIEDILEDEATSTKYDDQIEDLPKLEVFEYEYNNNEQVIAVSNEAYTGALMRGIIISDIEESEDDPVFEQGQNLATLKTLTKGSKNDPARGSGLGNMPPNILGRIGSFLSGKEGKLNNQRRQLRANVGYKNEENAAGAGAGAGANARRRKTRNRRRL